MLFCGAKMDGCVANKPKLFIDGTVRHLWRHVNTFAVEITALFKGAHQFSPLQGHQPIAAFMNIASVCQFFTSALRCVSVRVHPFAQSLVIFPKSLKFVESVSDISFHFFNSDFFFFRTDAKGTIREIVLPKGLDLDRPKRTRTSFTAEQLYRLELEFQRCQYVVGRERTELARQLNLSETQVRS